MASLISLMEEALLLWEEGGGKERDNDNSQPPTSSTFPLPLFSRLGILSFVHSRPGTCETKPVYLREQIYGLPNAF